MSLEAYREALERVSAQCQSLTSYYSQSAARALLGTLEVCLARLADCEPFLSPPQKLACLEIRDQSQRLDFEVRNTLEAPTSAHQQALIERVRHWADVVQRRKPLFESDG
jgi:hypothetical protein